MREGLREGIADDEEMRNSYCEVIEDEAQNMSDMIRRMTTLMQLQTGDGSLSTAPLTGPPWHGSCCAVTHRNLRSAG